MTTRQAIRAPSVGTSTSTLRPAVEVLGSKPPNRPSTGDSDDVASRTVRDGVAPSEMGLDFVERADFDFAAELDTDTFDDSASDSPDAIPVGYLRVQHRRE